VVQINELQPRGPFPDKLMLANGVSWRWVSAAWVTINVCPGCLQVRSVRVNYKSRGWARPAGMCLRCGFSFSGHGVIEGVVARFVYDPGQWWPWWTCRGKWEVSRQTMFVILEHNESDYLPRFSLGAEAALAAARVTQFGRSLNTSGGQYGCIERDTESRGGEGAAGDGGGPQRP